jgi:hypothetical protein
LIDVTHRWLWVKSVGVEVMWSEVMLKKRRPKLDIE